MEELRPDPDSDSSEIVNLQISDSSPTSLSRIMSLEEDLPSPANIPVPSESKPAAPLAASTRFGLLHDIADKSGPARLDSDGVLSGPLDDVDLLAMVPVGRVGQE